MFESLTALQSALWVKEPTDFVSHYLFERVPFAFSDDLDNWIAWKSHLATKLDVDPRNVVLTGSGAIGFSLNPTKSFKAFDETSDIDCGVISPHHFDLAWRYLRQLEPSWLSLPPESKRAIRTHRTRYVFSGTIATDSILALLPFGLSWQSALDTMSKTNPTLGRDVKLRIYKDYDALRHYQARGIQRLRTNLSAAESIESDIETEN